MSAKLEHITDDKLKTEITNLVQYVRRFRQEIAQMYQRQNDQTHFEGIGDQLAAITQATENATNTILQSVEQIDEVADKIREVKDVSELPDLCDELNNNTMIAMESCTFQDITGQRVTKIISSMRFVEERVEALAEIWGKDDIEETAVGLGDQVEEMDEDDQLLQGPAIDAQAAISQDDIDKLFD